MPTVRFTIGQAFPVADPVARFITVLAMMSNDWLRLVEVIRASPEDEAGLRVLLFRQQAALHHEAADFIREARRQFHASVDAFVRGLDASAQANCEQVVGGIDPRSPHFLGDWLLKNRNLTFHYPEMNADKARAGREEITEALSKAANLPGAITQERALGSVRFGFADNVTVQWLPDAQSARHVRQLVKAMVALVRFVQAAAKAYIESRPPGTFSVV